MFRACQARTYFPSMTATSRSNSANAIAQVGVNWRVGEKIKLSFLDGSFTQQSAIEMVVNEYREICNLEYEFVTNPSQADIRIAHVPGSSYSEIGRLARNNRNAASATFNIGWEGLPVIRHEFWHVHGGLHEHQNPAFQINWVLDYWRAALPGWGDQEIMRNIINQYSPNEVVGTDFDPLAIGLYPIEPASNTSGFSSGLNSVLSAKDKILLQTLYPFAEANTTGTTNTTNTEIIANPEIIFNGQGQNAGSLLLLAAAAGLAINEIRKDNNRGKVRNMELMKNSCGCGH